MTARKPAAGRMTDLNLADAANELGSLLQAVFMAAGALLDKDDQGAIQTVLHYAEHKLGEIQKELEQRLQAARGAA